MTTKLDSWAGVEFVTDQDGSTTIKVHVGHSLRSPSSQARLEILHDKEGTSKPANRIKAVRRRTLSEPTAVYDIENLRGHENFALGNGVIVHNSAAGGGRFARDEYYQEFLPMKGKSPNCVSGDTLILMADGSAVRIDSLTEDQSYGVGYNLLTKTRQVSTLSKSWITAQVTNIANLTFADGTELRCTQDHRILTTSGYVIASDLTTKHDLISSKIIKKELITLSEPIDVYDIENLSGHENFSLANGVILHNCLRMKPGAEIVNEEILNIFAMLGFDPRQEDPYDKLRVGKIIIMSDSDADGPLVGSTKVKMANGPSRTIQDLAEDWSKNRRSFDVWSVDNTGKVVPSVAVLPMEVYKAQVLYTVNFVGGTSFKCTGNHRWPVSNLGHDRVLARDSLGIKFVSADSLIPGDIIPSELHHVVESVTKWVVDYPEPVYCLSVPMYGNFLLEDQKGIGVATGNSHISALLLGVFYKYLPALFEKGMIYVTRVPEYYSVHKDIVYSGNTREETQASLDEAKVSSQINHLKGYGECPSDLLKIFAFEPTTRSLYKVKPCADDKFELLMADDTTSRKILLNI